MKCLIIAATADELNPFLKQFRKKKDMYPGIEIDVLITGPGLLATTYSLLKHIVARRPDTIIQAGVGGCFDVAIPKGTVFAIKQDVIADLGVIEAGRLKSLFDLKLASPNKYPFTKGWLINKGELLKKVTLKKVKSISVNEITTQKQFINQYKEIFDPVVESMEGAALHYVGLMEKIPFLQIRSVSNYIGERNKKKWKMEEAIFNLNNELINLLYIL